MGGNALFFDGVDDLVTVPTAGAASETAFTAEVWFRTGAAIGTLMELDGAGADRILYVRDGTVCWYVFAPEWSVLCTTERFDDCAWHHAAGTVGPTGQHLYVDGVLRQSAATIVSSAFDEAQLTVGFGYIGPVGEMRYFEGELDELRLWNVVRTAEEIAANRSGPIDPAASGLFGYWRLDESGDADRAADASSGGRAGTLTGFSFTPSPWIPAGRP